MLFAMKGRAGCNQFTEPYGQVASLGHGVAAQFSGFTHQSKSPADVGERWLVGFAHIWPRDDPLTRLRSYGMLSDTRIAKTPLLGGIVEFRTDFTEPVLLFQTASGRMSCSVPLQPGSAVCFIIWSWRNAIKARHPACAYALQLSQG